MIQAPAGRLTPLLVVEVVSEGTQIIDHRRKRAESNIIEIPEY